MNSLELNSYDELEAYLRNWRSWLSQDGEYDFNGMLHLLIACAENLNEHALEAELEDLSEVLTDDQRAALQRILSYSG